ncbi:MAG: YfcC family protein [Actinomycetia bacterium]|nr:YfcC family protein [Actinomycetes bacterium]MCH9800376.1 YfcC family protein [Actinomycetes bacterium]
MATETPATEAPEEPEEKKGFKFPTAFTVLFFVLLLVWGLTFIIPSGSYTYVACGEDSPKPIPGSYQQTESETSFQDSLADLLLSPVNGLYGIQEPQVPAENVDAAVQGEADELCAGETAEIVTAPGVIGPYESGELFGAVSVFFFVLAIGAFITVTMNTGALDAGIGRLTHRFRTRGTTLIIVLMFVFSLGGTSYGMAEETLGFYALIVPIFVALRYDRIVGATVILLGAGVGTLSSTVNPFATGVASDGAGIPLGDGIVLRLLMYLVLVPVTIWFVIRYANKVKKDPSKSKMEPLPDDEGMVTGDEEPPQMTGQQKGVLWIFILTFALMIFSVIPWGDFSESLESITLDWYFPELAALFLLMSVVVGLVGRLGEQGMVDSIVAGMGDFIGAAFIIAFAKGVTVIMNNSQITDTVLSSLESAVSGLSGAAFGVMIYIVNIPLAFLVPSSSAHATLAMPIMAPLGEFQGVSKAIVVTAYQSASGLVNLFTPTSAVVMGGLTLAKVGYDKYLRFVWPLLLILFVLSAILIGIGSVTPLGGSV